MNSFAGFLFLHSWRSTIITGLTLPIAVISSFIAVQAFGSKGTVAYAVDSGSAGEPPRIPRTAPSRRG